MWGDGCVNRHTQGPRWCRVKANARAVGAGEATYPCLGQHDCEEFLEEGTFNPVFYFPPTNIYCAASIAGVVPGAGETAVNRKVLPPGAQLYGRARP